MNYALKPGLGVYTKDGKLLGQVGALRPGEFKVDAPMALDYWLPNDCIESVRYETVLLRFPEEQVADYRREPGIAVEKSETHTV